MTRLETSTVNVMHVYNSLEKARQKYGKLKKAEIHFHTPASHDFELIKGKKYKDLTEEDILNYSVDIGYLKENQKDVLIRELRKGLFSGKNYEKIITDQALPYSDFKEYLSYMMIAYTLYKNEIDVAIVTDHNTIKGYKKMKFAVEEYFKQYIKPLPDNKKKCIYVVLGVEISCSDYTHIVGIFDENHYNKVQNILNAIIYDQSADSGTIETSLTVLKKIHDIGGIGYIAHVNTYRGIGTGLYKSSLFNYEHLKVLGSTNLEVDGWKSHLPSSFSSNRFCFFHESDAHSIEELSINNTWIKMNEISFNSLKKAINNHRFCIYTSKPSSTSKFIKGIFLKTNDNSFFKSRTPLGDFSVDFSKDLNCIIGGRGTGKSTLLNILDIVFTREAKSTQNLKFISQYEFIYIVFRLNETDYVLKCTPQVNSKISLDDPDFFLLQAFDLEKNRTSEVIHLSENWTELFEITDSNHAFEIKKSYDRDMILNKVYKKHYSINNIINKIENKCIGDFIKNTIFSGITNDYFYEKIQYLYDLNRTDFERNIKNSLKEIKFKLEETTVIAQDKIQTFNDINSAFIKILYSPNRIGNNHIFLEPLFNGINPNKRISSTILKWKDFIAYTYYIVERLGFLNFLELIFGKKFSELEKIQPIQKFISATLTIYDIGESREKLTPENIKNVYLDIYKTFKIYKDNVITALKKYLELVDDYTLQFNINSKESTESLAVDFRFIETLSLGQQVVAILTFIMEYGKFIGDSTPFIIDQPEDNLDNQYIYKNLVNSLQNLKNSRQVIVVTHNSTIVTNADSEQVIVLDTKDGNGFIKKCGYVSDKQIMKQILIHLEGGEEAFNIKKQNYSAILNN